MKILMLHNHYQRHGGEDQSFAVERDLLQKKGHQVLSYVKYNEAIDRMKKHSVVLSTIWNQSAYQEIRTIIRNEQPDIMHAQNTFPLISPSVYYAAKSENLPVVQTLRNYRLICPNALFFRDGHICELCLGKSLPWPSVQHACYRQSRSATGVVMAMLAIHRFLNTWNRKVDLYVALTNFARQKFIEAGMQPEKIVVKPNFVAPDPGLGQRNRKYALFVGRLSQEKGIKTLLSAWKQVDSNMCLKIIGDGVLATEVEQEASSMHNVEWLGQKDINAVYDYMGGASYLIFPSEWYETFGRVAIEAFARGTPVLASDIGAVGEITQHGYTGLKFPPGDVDGLVAKINWLHSHPEQLEQMGRNARSVYESHYTEERNYHFIMDIYERARTSTLLT